MKRIRTLAGVLGLVLLAATRTEPAAAQEKTMSMNKLTPVLFVPEIEPCLKFWVERLDFQKTVEVPEGNKLGFVILARDSVEVMYQSRASVAKDVPSLANAPSSSFLYVEVRGLDDIIKKLEGVEVVVPVRKTFYGAREIAVREPGGNVVAFAEFEQPAQP